MKRDERPAFGEISFSGKDIAVPPLKYDKLAVGGRNQLYLVSLVCQAHYAKQVRAILNGGARCNITANGGKVAPPKPEAWDSPRNPGNLHVPPDSTYDMHLHRLDYGLVHAMFVSRAPGFMPRVCSVSLWRELNSDRFTTPLLVEWLPYIEERLRELELLEDCDAFNCRCGVLSAHDGNLDTIVREGLESGDIAIQPLALS